MFRALSLIGSVAVAVAVASMAVNAQAAIITSWEGVDTAGGGTYDSSGVGVTDGTRSVKYTSVGAGFDQKNLYQPINPNAFLSTLASTGSLYIDVTGTDIAGSITDARLILKVTASGPTVTYTSPNLASTLGTTGLNKKTAFWDVSSLGFATSGVIVTTLEFSVQESNARTFNFDRLANTAPVTVPEPATLGVLGLVSVAMTSRRGRTISDVMQH